jgi:hypothetical protein
MSIKSSTKRKLVRTLAILFAAVLVLGLASSPTGSRAFDTAAQAVPETSRVMTRAGGSTGEDVPLAGQEAWAESSVTLAGAPDGAVVSAVQVKYHVAQAKAEDLQVQLRASGAEDAHVLWDKQTGDGEGLAQTTEELAAFQGAPVNGTWSLAVQGGSAEGYIDDFSLIVYYEADMPALDVQGDAGMPAFLSLPEGAAPASPIEDDDDKPSGEGAQVEPQAVPPGATIIHTQNFEGTFPATRWTVLDRSNDGFTRVWDDAHCDPCGGDWAAWPADGGANGLNPCGGADYPNNMLTWMIYGPFDLSDATEAGGEFIMWRQIEVNFDFIYFGASHNGTDFTGVTWDGNAGCTRHNVGFNAFAGDPSVWVAWVFSSDHSIRHKGPWVDDIVIWKMGAANPPANVKVDPPTQTVNVNQTFTVDILVENAVNLGAFEFALEYNNSCIRATGVTLGPFLGRTGRTVHEVGPRLPTGRVEYGAGSSGTQAGPSGNGKLATITFQARSAACTSRLDLRNAEVILTDTAGTPQPVQQVRDGDVQVVPNTCPPNNCPEDINGDGVVNIVDIQLVASKWGRSCPTR